MSDDAGTRFMQEAIDEVVATFPQEKAALEAEAPKLAAKLQAEGPLALKEGLGQKMGEVPGRIYHRWNLQFPGCWDDPAFVHAFFADNPQYRSPGWKPKQHSTRHGKTFLNGKPV